MSRRGRDRAAAVLAIALLAGAGCVASSGSAGPAAPERDSTLANRAATPAALPADRQRLGILVVDNLATCTDPHRIHVTVDGAPVATVMLTCPAPLVPNANHVIVTDSSPRTLDGPTFAIARGRHTLAVRDETTGVVESLSLEIPLYGNSHTPATAGKAPLADVVVVGAFIDKLDAFVDVRARLIIL